MPKLQTRKYLSPEPQILAFPDHYVNVPGKIEYTELRKLHASIADEEATKMQNIYTDTSKVLPRGLAVHIDGDGKVTAPVAAASGVTAVKPNAVLFDTIEYDKYSTPLDSQINAAILVHGFVRADRLYGKEKANLDNGMIYVVNK